MSTLLIILAVFVFMGIPALIFIAACIVGARASQQQEAFLSQLDVSSSIEPAPNWLAFKEKIEI